VIDRVVVDSQWIGSNLNATQIATTLRVNRPGRYQIELPTREERTGTGGRVTARPTHLIVEVVPPNADLHSLAVRLIRDAPRWEGRCLFCGEGDPPGHVDFCMVAEAKRTLAMIEAGLA
jgi:hypothetical protein